MTSSDDRPALRQLADRVGIVAEYLDQSGRETRVTSDETRVALLAAMGFDAATEEGARRALDAMDAARRGRLVEPVRVVRVDAADARALRVTVPEAWSGEVGWALALVAEGERIERIERAGRGPIEHGEMRLELPVAPPLGCHRVHLRLHHGSDHPEGEQTLIVVPARAPTPATLLGGRRVFGVTANLYTLRSARNWGAGDFGDLAVLARWCGEIGADFVGLNPLHALRNRGEGISPYSPVSRLFRNPLYLEVEAIPELAECGEARALLASDEVRRALRETRAADAVDYERVSALQRRILDPLFRTFARCHRDADTPRGRAFHEYVAAQGRPLDDFATFMALSEWMEERGESATRHRERGARAPFPVPGAPDSPVAHRPASWREWPDEYRHPSNPAVETFRREHRDAVDFHRWVQLELDRQLGEAARTAREAGLAVGLYQDLAIASAADGSDAWAFQDLLVDGVSIGAPPDEYAAAGQNWSLPPLHPLRLAEDRYAYWVTLLRSAFRHAGAVRIDHILGLFRQFWIPEGREGKDGAYVRFPTEELLGILALEATRAGALVVGEDLGTVPPEVPPTLERWGILGSRVLYFERDERGFRPAATYEPLSLTSANTHDMATLDGFWRARDVALRREAGIIDDDGAARARRERETERAQLVAALRRERVLPDDVPPDADGAPPGDPDVGGAALRGAVHDFLCRTPAALVALSLDDLVGESEPVNLPGVGGDRYPSWTRRLRLPLERLGDDPGVRRSLGRCAELRGGTDA